MEKIQPPSQVQLSFSENQTYFNIADLAWAAGVIDGEGCITIRKDAAKPNTKHRSTQYSLIIKVTMTHKPTLDRLKEIFNVGTVRPATKEKGRRKQPWNWVCRSGDAAYVLSLIYLFLITKKEEAKVALDFINYNLEEVVPRRPVSQETLKIRDEFYWELRNLKQREYKKTLNIPKT